jgi:parvulin-like peptidyl-prolyl isomerase
MSNIPKKMRCSHILLSWINAKKSSHTRELAYAIYDAKMIIADLQKGGYSWNTAVDEHTACLTTYNKGGDLGWFEEQDIHVNIWNACLITPVGELCQEPVDTPYGVHIIFRTG